MTLKALLITIDGFDKALFNFSNMSFMKSNVFKYINSVEPIITPACSASILTGLEPMKHGIYDFYDDAFRPINSKAVPYLYFTDVLYLMGYRLGIWKAPLIYPKKYRGFVVWGIEAPRITPDAQVENILRKIDYRIEEIERYKNDEQYLDIYKYKTLKEITIFKHLAKKYKIDIGFFWLRYSDIISHVFYGRRKELLKDYYEFLDKQIKDLIETLEPETWIVFGDHGFAENHFLISFPRFLLEEKIIRWRSRTQKLIHILTNVLGPDRLVKVGFLRSSGPMSFVKVNTMISPFYQFDDLYFIGSAENLLRFRTSNKMIKVVIKRKLNRFVRLIERNGSCLILPRKHVSLTRLVLKKPITKIKYKFRGGIHWIDTVVVSNDEDVLRMRGIVDIHDFIIKKLKRKIHRFH